jgi:hypothetical protein
MIIGKNFRDFWEAYYIKKISDREGSDPEGHLNVGKISSVLILHLVYSVRQQILAVYEVNFIPTVPSLASIPLQDLKDFMAKAGDVAYTSVQRPKAGEG